MPPHQKYPQVPLLAQTDTPNFTFFRTISLIISPWEITIKHSMYTWKVPFLCTERACVVFFQYRNSPGKNFSVKRSEESIKDQREYK